MIRLQNPRTWYRIPAPPTTSLSCRPKSQQKCLSHTVPTSCSVWMLFAAPLPAALRGPAAPPPLLHRMPPTPFLQPHESPGSYSLLGGTAHPGDAASPAALLMQEAGPWGTAPARHGGERGPAIWSLVPHTQESYTHAASCAPRTWSVRVKQLHRK